MTSKWFFLVVICIKISKEWLGNYIRHMRSFVLNQHHRTDGLTLTNRKQKLFLWLQSFVVLCRIVFFSYDFCCLRQPFVRIGEKLKYMLENKTNLGSNWVIHCTRHCGLNSFSNDNIFAFMVFDTLRVIVTLYFFKVHSSKK